MTIHEPNGHALSVLAATRDCLAALDALVPKGRMPLLQALELEAAAKQEWETDLSCWLVEHFPFWMGDHRWEMNLDDDGRTYRIYHRCTRCCKVDRHIVTGRSLG